MLKADFHLHTKEDPEDHSKIEYTAREIIDIAKERKYDVLSITLHNKVLNDKKIFDYAKKKGILIIPGVEKTIEQKHVVLINFKENDVKRIKKISDIKKFKKKNNLVIAPHPYLLHFFSLRKKLDKNIDIFDAIETSNFRFFFHHPGRKAVKKARKFNKSIIASSDAHALYQFGTCYTLIDSKKNVNSVIKAIKMKKTVAISKEHDALTIIKIIMDAIFSKKFLIITKNYLNYVLKKIV